MIISLDRDQSVTQFEQGRFIANKRLKDFYCTNAVQRQGWLEARIEFLENALKKEIGDERFETNYSARL